MNVARDQGNSMRDLTCSHRQHLGALDLRDRSGSFRLFTEGDDLYDAMISAIAAARRSIRLESFILTADAVGWRFAGALSAKARAGVDVRFQMDGSEAFVIRRHL